MAHDVGVKAGVLEGALVRCERETIVIEEEAAELVRETESLHEEALAMGKQLVATGPDLDVLRQKFEAARTRDRLADLHDAVNKQLDCFRTV